MTLATCQELILLIATTSGQVPRNDKKYIHKLFLTEKTNKQNPTNQKKNQIPPQRITGIIQVLPTKSSTTPTPPHATPEVLLLLPTSKTVLPSGIRANNQWGMMLIPF